MRKVPYSFMYAQIIASSPHHYQHHVSPSAFSEGQAATCTNDRPNAIPHSYIYQNLRSDYPYQKSSQQFHVGYIFKLHYRHQVPDT